MPQPTPGDVHISSALTNISVAYVQDASAFVADKVFPVVPVEHQSDQYWVFNKEDFLRDEARVRADTTESAGGGFNLGTQGYSAQVEAFHKDVGDQLRANADSVLQLDSAATRFVTQKLMIRRERRWAANFFSAGVWGTDQTPTTLWGATGSDPVADMETAKMAIQGISGFRANTLVLGPQVKSALRNNARVRDQFKFTSADSIDDAMLARLFGIERVFTMDAVYSPTIEGGASPTTQFIGGKNALLCYSPSSPSILEPAAGYTFMWRGYVGSNNGMRVKKFRMEKNAADRIEGEIAYDMRQVAPSLGYFFSGAVA